MANFLDLSKAFDCVSHKILLKKLKLYGFDQNSMSLMESYLLNREQYVTYDCSKSANVPINLGVPQGSILGPTLFLVYVNDFTDCLDKEVDVILYADDTTTINKHNNLHDLKNKVKITQSKVDEWYRANQLCQNKDKSEEIIFSLRSTDGTPSGSVKFLGVILDRLLTWEEHVDYICQKISKNLYLLRKLSRYLSQFCLINAYFGLIHSNISYAILAWGHSPHAKQVFKLQRKAIRIISGLNYRDNCKTEFSRLNILTVPSIFIQQCLIYVKNNENNYTHHYQIHSYPTRHRDFIIPSNNRLCKTRDGINYFGIQFHNKLPLQIKTLDQRHFKIKVKNILARNAFQNFEEFLDYDFSKECM